VGNSLAIHKGQGQILVNMPELLWYACLTVTNMAAVQNFKDVFDTFNLPVVGV
jgi:hypothetical protein